MARRKMAAAVKAVIFDLDGVLVDTRDVIVNTFQQVFREAGLPVPTREEIVAVESIGGRRILETLLPPGRRADAKYVERLRGEANRISRERLPEVKTVPGARELLAALKGRGIKLAIASNRGPTALDLLEANGLRAYFDAIVTSVDVKNLKPHPEPLLRALERLGVRADEAVFVGDSAADAEAGRAAGIKTILFLKDCGSHGSAAEGVGVIRALGEIGTRVV